MPKKLRANQPVAEHSRSVSGGSGGPQRSKRNPKAVGEMIETLFAYELLRRGVTVSQPIGDNAHYDSVADRGLRPPNDGLGRLVTVQVRGVIRKRDRRKAYRVCTRINRDERQLTADDAQVLAAYVAPEKTWYLIPVSEFAPASQLPLYPHIAQSNGRFECWKEAWWLLAPDRSADWVLENWMQAGSRACAAK